MTDQTFFVRTDGSDDNDGVVDSAEGAFLTWNRGIEAAYKTSIRRGTIVIAAGDQQLRQTFVENLRIGPLGFSGRLILRGAGSQRTTISSKLGDTVLVSLAGNTQVRFDSLRLEAHLGNAVKLEYQSLVSIGSDVDFGYANESHLWVHDSQSMLQVLASDYSISGNCRQHVLVQYGHVFYEANRLRLADAVEFSNAFIVAYPRGTIQATDNQIDGGARGRRFDVRHQSVMNLCGNTQESQLAGDLDGISDESSCVI